MRRQAPPDYLAAYPAGLVAEVRQLIAQGQLAPRLLRKYPAPHTLRSDRALYDYSLEIKQRYLRHSGVLSRVEYDSKLTTLRNALGTHTSVSRVQGQQLKAKREIRVATVFREMPEEFLRMIVVHELAHLKEAAHDKAFYQLCRHMAVDYHQLEFDLRVYLTYLDAGGAPLWPAAAAAAS